VVAPPALSTSHRRTSLTITSPTGETSRVPVRGGFNVPAAGAPAPRVEELPVPERLEVPLASPRFRFTDIRVTDGQKVAAGGVLAVDPDRFGVPLLAPLGGTARLEDGRVVLEQLDDAPAETSSGEPSVRRLVELGAWSFVADARTREPVDPEAAPRGIVASLLRLEPFLAGGEAQLPGALERVARGVASLSALAPDAPLYVVVPDAGWGIGAEVRAEARKIDGAHVVTAPLRFPFDDPALVARFGGLPSEHDDVVWSLRTEGVLAVNAALNEGRPALDRVVSVAGPAVADPAHVRVPLGYPVDEILEGRLCRQPARVVGGGLLTGATLDEAQRGVDVECTGLTVLAEPTRQTLISFARPGVSRRSYSRTFVGTLRTDMSMRYRASLAGELRPCISCGQCADVCPAGILPGVIHKQLYAHRIEEAQRLRIDLCVGCGLCSFVCPSKIDLRREFLTTVAQLREEAETIRAERAAAEEAAKLAEEEAAAAGESSPEAATAGEETR